MKKKERKSNSRHCSALAIMFVLPLRHTHIIFKNQVWAEGSKIDRVVQSPKIQISIASATNWSSHVPRGQGLLVFQKTLGSRLLTGAVVRTGLLLARWKTILLNLIFWRFTKISVSTFTLQREVFYSPLCVGKGTGHFWMRAFHYSSMAIPGQIIFSFYSFLTYLICKMKYVSCLELKGYFQLFHCPSGLN